MRQVVYVSTAVMSTAPDANAILAISRRNNAEAGITGLLYSDGKRFLQALEGEEAAVAATLARIERDGRHRAIVILSDRCVPAREFGSWSMAHRRPGTDTGIFMAQIGDLVADASPSVRATFRGFAEARSAA